MKIPKAQNVFCRQKTIFLSGKGEAGGGMNVVQRCEEIFFAENGIPHFSRIINVYMEILTHKSIKENKKYKQKVNVG